MKFYLMVYAIATLASLTGVLIADCIASAAPPLFAQAVVAFGPGVVAVATAWLLEMLP